MDNPLHMDRAKSELNEPSAMEEEYGKEIIRQGL
jgi:hypothetical protein